VRWWRWQWCWLLCGGRAVVRGARRRRGYDESWHTRCRYRPGGRDKTVLVLSGSRNKALDPLLEPGLRQPRASVGAWGMESKPEHDSRIRPQLPPMPAVALVLYWLLLVGNFRKYPHNTA
jgi:hypothetical protein